MAARLSCCPGTQQDLGETAVSILSGNPGLVKQAAGLECAQLVYLEAGPAESTLSLPVKRFQADGYRVASMSDQKRQVQQWLQSHQNLYRSPIEAAKLNVMLNENQAESFSWLIPSQLKEIAGK